MTTAYIGLGSNLDHPAQQIRAAVDRLCDVPGIILKKLSSLYQSHPLGLQDQPDFINAVAEITTELSAESFLSFLQDIEVAQHRIRKRRWGARTIDLDILLFGDEIIQTNNLQVPHPGLSQREFVVYPLMEIAPNLRLPTGEALADLTRQCPRRGIKILPSEIGEMSI